MEVKQIPYGENLKLKSQAYPYRRCQMKVNSTGVGSYEGDQTRCSRQARYDINGLGFCKQHAGDSLLNYHVNDGQPD